MHGFHLRCHCYDSSPPLSSIPSLLSLSIDPAVAKSPAPRTYSQVEATMSSLGLRIGDRVVIDRYSSKLKVRERAIKYNWMLVLSCYEVKKRAVFNLRLLVLL